MTAEGWEPPPSPAGVGSYDELTERLRSLRAWAGLSYREIHRRVVCSRRDRAIAELPARDTVHRCLQPGRRRLDVELVVDIARVLLDDDARAMEWRQACQVLAGQETDAAIVQVASSLPDDPDSFVGRDAELAELAGLFGRRAGGVVVIQGMAGVGKTVLAIHAAHRLREFADLRLSVSLRGYDPDRPPADPAAVLDGFLRQLGVPGSQIVGLDMSARAARFQELLTGRRVLVLLDNAAGEEQVRPLLPAGPGSLVLVTSRRRLPALPAHHLSLDVFTPAESLQLLRRIAGRERIDADRISATRIADLAGNLPLALALVAGRVSSTADWTLADHLERLLDQRSRLCLDDGVAVAMTSSYQALPADHRRLLRLLALSPGRDADGYAAAALAGEDLETSVRRLADLRTANLLRQRTAGLYEMHDLVRVFATGQARDVDAPRARRAALTRLFDHYRYTAASAMNRYSPSDQHRRPRIDRPDLPCPELPDGPLAMRWLDDERETLVAVAVHAAENGWPAHAGDLSWILHRYLINGAFYQDAQIVHLRASRVASGIARGHAVHHLGISYNKVGRYADALALHRQALALFQTSGIRSCGDPGNEGSVLNSIGIVYQQTGRYPEALDQFRRALDLVREAGDHRLEWVVLGNLGGMYLQLGRPAEALDHCRRVLELARAAGDPLSEVHALCNVGGVCAEHGPPGEALEYLQQAVVLSRELGQRRVEGGALASLGRVRTRLGQYHQALEHHAAALAVFRDAGDRDVEAEALNDLGGTLGHLAQVGPALDRHHQALRIAEDLGDRYQQARAHDGIARGRLATGDIAEARSRWQRALALFTDLGTPEATEITTRLASLDSAEQVPSS